MPTERDARDALYQLVRDAWGTRGPIDYEDLPQTPGCPIPPEGQEPWLRLKLMVVQGSEPVLVNAVGSRCFRENAIFMVQVFTPFGTGMQKPEELGQVVVRSLRGKSPLGIFIRQVTKTAQGSDGHWYQVNVTANVEYDEQD